MACKPYKILICLTKIIYRKRIIISLTILSCNTDWLCQNVVNKIVMRFSIKDKLQVAAYINKNMYYWNTNRCTGVLYVGC